MTLRKKNSIVVSAVVIALGVVMLAFSGNGYNNSMENHEPLSYYISSYGLQRDASVGKTFVINGTANVTYDAAESGVSDIVNISYVEFSSLNGMKGLLAKVTVDGTIAHESLVLERTSKNNISSLTIIPIVSTSGKYNSITITNDSSVSHETTYLNSVYIDLQAYALSNGVGFNQAETVTLITLMGMDAALGGLASVGTLAALFALGAGVMAWYDNMGGSNGVSITWGTVWFIPYVWINAPFDPAGSNVLFTETLFQGNVA